MAKATKPKKPATPAKPKPKPKPKPEAAAKPAVAVAVAVAVTVEPPRGVAPYPFPFFGEGLAQYFEWADLHVWFAAAPNAAARKAIVAGMPRPLAKSVDWDGPAMNCGNGDQQANRAIREAYPPIGKDRWANDRQLTAFEADIRSWLAAIHAKYPIAFVARREDLEAGGTKLGEWHHWSMQQLRDHLARVDAAPPKIVGHRAWALAVPLQLAQHRSPALLPPKYVTWLQSWYARR